MRINGNLCHTLGFPEALCNPFVIRLRLPKLLRPEWLTANLHAIPASFLLLFPTAPGSVTSGNKTQLTVQLYSGGAASYICYLAASSSDKHSRREMMALHVMVSLVYFVLLLVLVPTLS